MPDVRVVLSNVALCLWWPLSKILATVHYVLAPAWTVLRFVLLPVTSLLHAVYTVVSYPFSVAILERFETLYMWLGIAGLLGCVTAAFVFVVFKGVSTALGIDAASVSRRSQRKSIRSVQEHRAQWRARSRLHDVAASDPLHVKMETAWTKGASAQQSFDDDSDY